MAVVAIPLAELLWLGCGAIAALWVAKNPPKFPAARPQTLPPIVMTKSLEERLKDSLAPSLAKVKTHIATTCKDCPSCDPPAGHICAFVHMHSVSNFHHPCIDPSGGHVHTYIRSQTPPPACICTWIKGEVICFTGDENHTSISSMYNDEKCKEVKNANHF